MRMKLLSACIVVAVGGGYSLAAHSQVKPEVLVKQRQAAMTLQGKYFGPLGGMLKGSVPYNADVVARNAGYLDALSQDAMGRFRREHQGREERGAAGGLHRRREVQTGAGPVPDRGDRAGRSVEERQRRRRSRRRSATSARRAAAATTTSARSSIPTASQARRPRCGGVFVFLRSDRDDASQVPTAPAGRCLRRASPASRQRSAPRPRRATRSAANTSQRRAAASAATRGREGRRAVRGRARAQDPVRHLLRAEHHAPPAGGDRALDRGRFHHAPCARACGPDGANYFPGVPVPLVHEDHRRRPARPLGVPADAAAERPRQPAARAAVFRTAGVFRSAAGSGSTSRPARSHPTPRRRRRSTAAPTSCRRWGIAASAIRRATSSAGRSKDRFLAGGQGARRQERPEPDPDPAQEAERRGAQGLSHHRDDPGRRRRRRRRWARSSRTRRASSRRPTSRRSIAYLRTLPALPDEPR